MGACGFERLDGEWLVLIWCAATNVRLQWALRTCRIERLDGDWLVLMWRAATDARLHWAIVEGSVYMGNGWFCREHSKNPGHRFMRRENAASTWEFGSKMCSRMKWKVGETLASTAYPEI